MRCLTRGLVVLAVSFGLLQFAMSKANAQLLSVDRLAVFDSTERRVGRVIGFDNRLPTLAFVTNGRFFVLDARKDALVAGGKVWYTDESCGEDGGTAYVGQPNPNEPRNILPFPTVAGNKVFVPADPDAIPVEIQLNSELLFDGTCQFVNTVQGDVTPAIILVDLGLEFTPPFTVGEDIDDGTAVCLERCKRRLELKQR